MTVSRRKRCRTCGEEKFLSKCNFHRRKDSPDGFRNDCVECRRKEIVQNRELKIDHYRALQARYNARPDQRAKRAAYARSERGRAVHREVCRRYNRFKRLELRA